MVGAITHQTEGQGLAGVAVSYGYVPVLTG